MADLIAELEGVVRLCERAGKMDVSEYADGTWVIEGPKSAIQALGGATAFLRTHHAEIAAAVRDARRWQFLCTADPDGIDDVVDLIMACADKPDLDAAMDTAMRAGEGEG
jgi:hypothetical protein